MLAFSDLIEGGPDRHEAWGDLTGLLGRTWPHERGAHLKIARLAIDTGYEAPAVYGWSRAQGFAQVAPVKGVEGFNRASPVSGPTRKFVIVPKTLRAPAEPDISVFPSLFV